MLQQLVVNIKLNSCSFGLSPVLLVCPCSASKDVRATNNTNKEMNDANNELQIKLWNEQKEYDYQKWKETNEYNTPAAQKQRYLDAGINPTLALSNLTSGSAASTAGGQSTPPTTAATFESPAQARLGTAQNLLNVGSTISDLYKNYQQSQQTAIQNQWLNAEKAVNLGKEIRSSDLISEGIYSAKRANRLGDLAFNANLQEQEERANYQMHLALNEAAKGTILELQKDSMDYYNKNIQPSEWQKIQVDMKTALSNALSNYINAQANDRNSRTSARLATSQIELNKETIKQIKANIGNTIEDTETKKFWNNLNSDQQDLIVKKMVAEYNKVSAEAGEATVNTFLAPFKVAGSFIPR